MSKGKEKAEKDAEGGGQGGGKPKKRGMIKIILGAVLLLGLGAGGAYGAYAMGLFGGDAAEEPDNPKLVMKGEGETYPLPGAEGSKDAAPPVYGEGGSKYRTVYYSFEESFTSNLAIRSAILAQLAATPEAEVYDVGGKERLAKRLTAAINAVLEENEGFGGIDAVHFRGFLVQ
jgi:flagellar FliL protein